MEPVELQPDTTGFAIGFNRAALQVDTESLAARLCLQNVLDCCSRTRSCTLSTFKQRLPCLQHWKRQARHKKRQARHKKRQSRQCRRNAARALQLAQGKRFVRFKCYVFLRCPSFLLQCQDCALGQGTKPAKTAPLPTLSKPLASDAFGLAFACCFMEANMLLNAKLQAKLTDHVLFKQTVDFPQNPCAGRTIGAGRLMPYTSFVVLGPWMGLLLSSWTHYIET